MKKAFAFWAPGLLALLSCQPRCQAGFMDDFNLESLDGPSSESVPAFHFENDTWSAGLSGGYALPMGSKRVERSVTSTLPVFTGQAPTLPTTIRGELKGGLALSLDVFRRVAPWASVGLEGSYQNHAIDQETAPGDSTAAGTWKRHIVQVMPAIKFGRAKGSFRPYASLAAGWAFQEETFSQDFGTFDTIDGPARIETSGHLRHNFPSVRGGAGLDFGIPGAKGLTIGLEAIAEHFFASSSNAPLSFVVPRLHFDYHFAAAED